jgi:pectinesterase
VAEHGDVGSIRPEGWDNWRDPSREKTVRYAEFNSSGRRANAKSRVSWARQLTPEEAAAVTIKKVFGGTDSWKPN